MKRIIIAAFALMLTAASGFARQPERGYRGFAEWTNRIYRMNYGSHINTHYSPGIATSHGFQFNPWLFVGGGIDYTLDDSNFLNGHHYQPDNYLLSLFAEGRTNLQFGKFTPFADVRLGWNATSNGTVYFSPSIGYRFNWGRKIGINVGIGYTLDGFQYEEGKQVESVDGYLTWIPTGEHYTFNQSSFTFRLGIDF